jgi:hypothetical protein
MSTNSDVFLPDAKPHTNKFILRDKVCLFYFYLTWNLNHQNILGSLNTYDYQNRLDKVNWLEVVCYLNQGKLYQTSHDRVKIHVKSCLAYSIVIK